jgi:hypothetical protein
VVGSVAVVKMSEFKQAIADEFGVGYGRVLAADLVLGDVGSRTANQALSDGVPPREVWLALCRATDVPRERWYGVGTPPPRA